MQTIDTTINECVNFMTPCFLENYDYIWFFWGVWGRVFEKNYVIYMFLSVISDVLFSKEGAYIQQIEINL